MEFSQEQLLGRASAPLELSGAKEQIAGRRIAVTGAAGSVGVPLVKLLLRLHPAELLLLDHHEHSLFRLRQEISPRPTVPIRWVLADVRDQQKVRRVFQECRPQIIFHLAAYKHVPLGEENPDQTVQVNLGGTRTVIEAAAHSEAERFVYPSSDKAVNPPSVYGSTKKIAERLTLAANQVFPMKLSVARFVNIVGTRGSVIETLAAQIAAGAPLTLTDPNMTRYWITMPEATRLLLKTAAAPVRGVVYMPDPGPPINLETMARHLFRLLSPQPAAECTIQFIGARAGERIHEILVSSNETTRPTPYPGIVEVVSSRDDLPAYGELSSQIDALLALAQAGDLAILRRRVLDLANSLQ